jgi:hypothetical protein
MECSREYTSCSDLLYIDNDLLINNIPVIRIRHTFNINDHNVAGVIHIIDLFMLTLTDNKYILLVNFDEMDHDISISKIKDIILYVEKMYIQKIFKIVIYNYNIVWKFLIDILLTVLNKKTKEKLCFKKNIETI